MAGAQRQSRAHAIVILVLLGLFIFRVVAQLIQLFAPTPILPPFEAWHSGTLPYGILVASQVAIIAVAVWFARGLWAGTIKESRRVGVALAWIGGLYFLGSVARVVAGFTFARTNPFLSAHLPGFFHIVLAAMAVTAAHYYLDHIQGEAA